MVSSPASEVVGRFRDRVWLHGDVEGANAYVADQVVFRLFGATTSGIKEWNGDGAVEWIGNPRKCVERDRPNPGSGRD